MEGKRHGLDFPLKIQEGLTTANTLISDFFIKISVTIVVGIFKKGNNWGVLNLYFGSIWGGIWGRVGGSRPI